MRTSMDIHGVTELRAEATSFVDSNEVAFGVLKIEVFVKDYNGKSRKFGSIDFFIDADTDLSTVLEGLTIPTTPEQYDITEIEGA